MVTAIDIDEGKGGRLQAFAKFALVMGCSSPMPFSMRLANVAIVPTHAQDGA